MSLSPQSEDLRRSVRGAVRDVDGDLEVAAALMAPIAVTALDRHIVRDELHQEWRRIADAALRRLADRSVPFEPYDLTEAGVPDPEHPNAWGALFRAACRRGVIEPVGYGQSRRPGRAGGTCRIWRGVRPRLGGAA